MKSVIPTKSIRPHSIFVFPVFGKMKIANINDKMIKGKLTMKMDCQSQDAIKNPPIDGPKAADVVEKIDKVAKAFACPSVIFVRTMLIPLGNKVELPMACSARHPSRKGRLGENGAKIQETATKRRPIKNSRFGPNISLSFPITG